MYNTITTSIYKNVSGRKLQLNVKHCLSAKQIAAYSVKKQQMCLNLFGKEFSGLSELTWDVCLTRTSIVSQGCRKLSARSLENGNFVDNNGQSQGDGECVRTAGERNLEVLLENEPSKLTACGRKCLKAISKSEKYWVVQVKGTVEMASELYSKLRVFKWEAR